MQITLVVAAHQLAVLRECRIAFDDARAHARPGLVGLFCMLWKLQRRAAMPDRKSGAVERAVDTFHQSGFELAFVHPLHEVEGSRAQLDGIVLHALAMAAVVAMTVIIFIVFAAVETLAFLGVSGRRRCDTGRSAE